MQRALIANADVGEDDHRGAHLAALDARLARALVDELDRIACAHVIRIAGRERLATLRSEARRLHRPGIVVDEIAPDLAWPSHLDGPNLIEPRRRATARRRAALETSC